MCECLSLSLVTSLSYCKENRGERESHSEAVYDYNNPIKALIAALARKRVEHMAHYRKSRMLMPEAPDIVYRIALPTAPNCSGRR